MSKIINTVAVILLLSLLGIWIAKLSIEYTIEYIDYQNIKAVTIEELTSEEGVDSKFIRLNNVTAYYFYAIKTYNSFSTPESPAAIYFPILEEWKADFDSIIAPEKFKIIIRDENYDPDIINEKDEMTLSVISFDAKIKDELPDTVIDTLKSKFSRKYFNIDKLIILEKDVKPFPFIITILLYIIFIAVLIVIIYILKIGGVEIIRVSRQNVKVKKVKDNIGDI